MFSQADPAEHGVNTCVCGGHPSVTHTNAGDAGLVGGVVPEGLESGRTEERGMGDTNDFHVEA